MDEGTIKTPIPKKMSSLLVFLFGVVTGINSQVQKNFIGERDLRKKNQSYIYMNTTVQTMYHVLLKTAMYIL